MRILATADIHIGRRPAGVPGDAAERWSGGEVWLRISEEAREREVDAVVLAGDIVDQENRFYEALVPFEMGLRRLSEKGIPVYAVAGNHDWDVLAQLADANTVEGFYLLGKGGNWESRLLPNPGDPRFQILGWSFPQKGFSGDPLSGFPSGLIRSGIPSLGLLHADRDASGGPYAPVSRRALEQAGDLYWILGHVHKPDPLEDDARTVYPGSPQGLDPGIGECGIHGPVLLDFSSGTVALTRLKIGGIRYENCLLELADLSEKSEINPEFSRVAREFAGNVLAECPGIEVLCIRASVRCTSRLPMDEFAEALRELTEEGQSLMVEDGTRILFDRLEFDIRPQVDLDALSEGQGILGQLAGLLKELQDEEPDLSNETKRLLDRIVERREKICSSSVFRGLPADVESEASEDVRGLLCRQAWALLHELLRGGQS